MAALDPLHRTPSPRSSGDLLPRRLRLAGALRKTGALVLALAAALWLAGLRVGAAPAQQAPPISPLLLPVSPLAGAALPSLEGTVVVSGSATPLAGIEITAYQHEAASWRPVRRTTTDDNGVYRFPRMSAGVYRLLADDPFDSYARIYYPAAPQIDLAANVVLMAEPVTGVDLALAPGGTLSGTISWRDGPAPFDVEVILYRWRETSGPTPDAVENSALAIYWDTVASIEDRTEPESNTLDFNFRGLPAGLYRLCALGRSLVENRSECYADALLGRLASGIVLESGRTVTGLDIDLGESADAVRLTGQVRTEDGTPAAGVEVTLVPQGTQEFGPAPSSEQTSTDANGVYTFTRLIPGAYTLTLDDIDERRYLPLTYTEAENPTVPAVLGLTPGSNVVIDAIVSPAAIISGYVTLGETIPGINGQVYPYRQEGDQYVPLNLVNIDPATGAFRVAGLDAGTYVLQVQLQPEGSNVSFFVGGADAAQATPYVLAAGQQITDTVLDATAAFDALPFGMISGTVTLDGAPQAGIRVELYRSPDRSRVPPPTVIAQTNANGRFQAAYLPRGDYLVGFVDPNGIHATVYYPNQPVFAQAQPLTIGQPEADKPNKAYVIGNVDAALALAGSIARTAQRGDGMPLVDVEVVLFRSVDEQGFAHQGTTRTDGDGVYRFSGLLPGSYRACILIPAAAGQDCADVGLEGQSFSINVLAGVASTGVDTVLEGAPEAAPDTAPDSAPTSDDTLPDDTLPDDTLPDDATPDDAEPDTQPAP